MPYLPKPKRRPIDRLVAPLLLHLRELPVEEQDGALNYVCTVIIRHLYPSKYFHYNRALGVLTAVLLELYRTQVGPYEEERRAEHGDV